MKLAPKPTGLAHQAQTASRRGFLRIFGLSIGASLLAACGQSTTASPTAAPATTKPAAAAAPPAAPSPVSSPAASASPAASPAAGSAAAPTADPALASVWQGKTVTATVGFTPGGGNDTWTRLLARYYPKYLPGTPTMIVENHPGAGGVVQVNQLYEARPDGLTFGNVERGIPTFQLRGDEGVRFDVTKLGWLGSVTQEAYFLVVTARSGVTSVNQLVDREIKVGLLTPGDFSHTMVVALKEALGWKMRSVFGYAGQSEVVLAMDRGEIDASAISWSSIVTQKRDDLARKVILPLFSVGVEQNDPLAAGAVRSDELFRGVSESNRQLFALVEQPLTWSRSFAVPPNTPSNIVTGMRNALIATTNDPEFRAEAERLKFDVIPVEGERIQQLITSYMGTPKSIFDRLTDLVKADSGE